MGLWLKASIMERLSLARNYRGKLLGVVLALLILWAAIALEMALLPGMILYCDNKGVISLANCPLMSLPEKQEQADLIQLIKHLTSRNRCWSEWEWVEGHAVEQKGWENYTLPE
jgi:hypothetical protein